MATENATVNRGYELPYKGNKPSFDVDRLVAAINAIDGDVATILGALAIKAALASPAFEGNPTAPTQPVGTNNNSLATTGHVQAALSAFLDDAEGAIETITALQAALSGAGVVEDLMALIALKAPLDSPSFGGTPTSSTPSTETNTPQIATAAFVQAVRAAIIGGAPTNLNTLAKIAASIGNDPNFIATVSSVLAGKAALNSPEFTGNPTVPTQPPGNNTPRAANTAFVKAAIDVALTAVSQSLSAMASTKADLTSPAFNGIPTVPTRNEGDSTAAAANTFFVGRAVSASMAFAILQDRKNAGTSGGSTVADTWSTHSLNTEVADPSGIVSLAGNVFMPTVSCLCDFWSVFYRTGVGKCRIWNITDGTEVAVGSAASASDSAGISSHSIGAAVLSGGKQYRMEYFATSAKSGDGLGRAGGNRAEIFAQVILRRI